MKKSRIVIPFLLFILFIIAINNFPSKERPSEQSLSKETEQPTKPSYPTFIGDEGILDATKATTSPNLEEKEAIDTEIASNDEPAEDIFEEEAQEETVREEVIESEEVLPTSSEVEDSKNASTEKISQPKEKEVKKTQVDIPKSTLAITDYFLPNANSEERVEPVTHVVLHFASNALNKPNNPYLIQDTYNIFKDYGVSAHYVIGRAGEIYSFVPENRVAYHAGPGQLNGFPEYNNRLNHHSIGIELLAIGTREEMAPIITAERFDQIDPSLIGYTEAQYQSLNTLLHDIISRHPTILKKRQHIVGHDEYAGDKTDPGSLFNWSKIGL